MRHLCSSIRLTLIGLKLSIIQLTIMELQIKKHEENEKHSEETRFLCKFMFFRTLWFLFFSALAAIDLSVQHKNLCLISMVR